MKLLRTETMHLSNDIEVIVKKFEKIDNERMKISVDNVEEVQEKVPSPRSKKSRSS